MPPDPDGMSTVGHLVVVPPKHCSCCGETLASEAAKIAMESTNAECCGYDALETTCAGA